MKYVLLTSHFTLGETEAEKEHWTLSWTNEDPKQLCNFGLSPS